MNKKIPLLGMLICSILFLTSCNKAYDIPKMYDKGINISKSDFENKMLSLLDYEVVLNSDLCMNIWQYEEYKYDDNSYKSTSYAKGNIAYDYQSDSFTYDYFQEAKEDSKENMKVGEQKYNVQCQPYVEEYCMYELLSHEYKKLDNNPIKDLFKSIIEEFSEKYNNQFSTHSEGPYEYYQSQNIYTASYCDDYYDKGEKCYVEQNVQIQHRGNEFLFYWSNTYKYTETAGKEYFVVKLETKDVTIKPINHEDFMMEVNK